MHYKRRSRRRDKAHYAPCGCCVDNHAGQKAPIESEICNGKSRSKRVRPKKERCPANGTHEWYKEWVEETDWHIPYQNRSCDECGAWFCAIHGERIYFKRRNHQATCIHCWTVKILKTESDRRPSRRPGYSRYGFGKLYLPKRRVKF